MIQSKKRKLTMKKKIKKVIMRRLNCRINMIKNYRNKHNNKQIIILPLLWLKEKMKSLRSHIQYLARILFLITILNKIIVQTYMNVFEMEMISFKSVIIKQKNKLNAKKLNSGILMKIIKILEIFILNSTLFNFLNSSFM